jgi:uncharacterized membrane protein YdbT with pleckstrin-like domain
VSYPTKLLAPGELIAVEFKPHWRGLIWPAIVLIAEVFLGTWLYFSVAGWSIGSFSLAWLQLPILLVLLGILIWRVILPFARWFTTQYVFTTRRIIIRRGLLTKQGRDMPLAKVNNVSFQVGLLGRIFNYGELEIESASDDGDMYIQDVPDVEQIQRLVYELHELDDARRRAGDGTPDRLPPMD